MLPTYMSVAYSNQMSQPKVTKISIVDMHTFDEYDYYFVQIVGVLLTDATGKRKAVNKLRKYLNLPKHVPLNYEH